MSCSCCDSSPCSCSSSCDAADEALSSVLNNLVVSMIGTPTKTCVNNVVQWVLPCNLDAGVPEFPKNSGESIACYFLRFMSSSSIAQATGEKGYRTTVLSNVSQTLVPHTDVTDQDFTGTLIVPVSISMSSSGASAGDHFYISFTALVVTAINSLTIQSNLSPLFVFNTAGTLNGYLKGVYTGTAWKITLNSVNVS